MILAITGHRPQRLNFNMDVNHKDWDKVKTWLKEKIIELNVDIVFCGMAEGCDIMTGIVVCDLIDAGYKINLVCVLPCKDYGKKNKYFGKLKKYASKWIELSDEFYKGCDNIRDKYMADNCDIMIAIWDGNKNGGVWSTINKAKIAGKKIIYCPKDAINLDNFNYI